MIDTNLYEQTFASADQRMLRRYFKFMECVPVVGQEVYGESHHILPRSMFPQYEHSDWNIKRIDARAHYIAHHLLWKALRNQEMTHAFWWMSHAMRPGRKYKKVSSKTYAILKSEKMKMASEYMSKRTVSEETRKRQSISGKAREPMSDLTKFRMSQARRGRALDAEVKGRKYLAHARKKPNVLIQAERAHEEYKNGNRSDAHLARILSISHSEARGLNRKFAEGWNPSADIIYQEWKMEYGNETA